MAHILDLPAELLSHISAEAMPEGFESFVLSCKTIYNASANLLERHNTLRRLYKYFEYVHDEEPTPDQEGCYSSLELLQKIADDPLIAKYITCADFKYDNIPWEDDYENIELQVAQSRESSNFLSLLKQSNYLQGVGVETDFILDTIFEEYQNSEDAEDGLCLGSIFLLSLLPNVQELSLPSKWEFNFNLHPVPSSQSAPSASGVQHALLTSIISAANDPLKPLAGLSNLTTILPSAGYGYDNRSALSNFTPFLSILSVKNFISGSSIALDDGYTGIPFLSPIPNFPTFGCNLEKVVLAGACLDSAGLTTFLAPMKKLRSLKISYETKWHGCGSDIASGEIMSAIEGTVGTTLEILEFEILQCYGTQLGGVTSMKNFTKLRELKLDIKLLYASYCASGEEETARIGDVLPMGLEKFTLLVQETKLMSSLLNMFLQDSTSVKEEKMRGLKEIVIWLRGNDDFVRETLSSWREEEGGIGVRAKTRSRTKEKKGERRWIEELKALKGTGVEVDVSLRDRDDGIMGFCNRYGVDTG